MPGNYQKVIVGFYRSQMLITPIPNNQKPQITGEL
jgi:hypothetical protein